MNVCAMKIPLNLRIYHRLLSTIKRVPYVPHVNSGQGKPGWYSSFKQFHTQECRKTFYVSGRNGGGDGYKSKEKQMHVHYLVDEEWAQYAVEVMSQHFDIASDKTTLFETNAGPGVLSLFLLKNGAKQIYGFETSQDYLSALEHLQESYLGHFYCVKGYLYRRKDWWIKPSPWDKECTVRVVGSMPSKQLTSLVGYWVECLALGSGIFMHGRVEQYLLVTGMEVSLIEEGKKALAEDRKLVLPGNIRPSRAVLYPLLFDIEVIMQIPVECFNPPKVREGWKRLDWDRQNQYMIKVVPKLDLYDSFPAERLPEFVGFVRQIMLRKTERLVPLIESWLPGFGLWLLDEGYDLLQHAGDLKLKDYYRLYKSILDHPVYELPAFSKKEIFKADDDDDVEDIDGSSARPVPTDHDDDTLETDPNGNGT